MIKYTFLKGQVFIDESNYFQSAKRGSLPIRLSVVLFVKARSDSIALKHTYQQKQILDKEEVAEDD